MVHPKSILTSHVSTSKISSLEEQTHPDPTKRKMVAIVLAVLCTFGLGFALWYATRYPQTALHYWNQGQAALAQGEYIRAIALYSDALRLEPNFAQAYIGRGEAYGRKGEYDHAIADYLKPSARS